MLCYPAIDQPFDVPFWVNKSDFLSRFDQDDFACRDVVDVSQAYLSDWFYVDAGRTYFMLSPVTAVKGKTQFISGRHRLAVLLPHLAALPIAFAFSAHLGDRERSLLEAIPKRPLDLNEQIELADFPVRLRLP